MSGRIVETRVPLGDAAGHSFGGETPSDVAVSRTGRCRCIHLWSCFMMNYRGKAAWRGVLCARLSSGGIAVMERHRGTSGWWTYARPGRLANAMILTNVDGRIMSRARCGCAPSKPRGHRVSVRIASRGSDQLYVSTSAGIHCCGLKAADLEAMHLFGIVNERKVRQEEGGGPVRNHGTSISLNFAAPSLSNGATYSTLHMWTQVVGKCDCAESAVNHWEVPRLQRAGLRTSPILTRTEYSKCIRFHRTQLEIATTAAKIRSCVLVRAVADFSLIHGDDSFSRHQLRSGNALEVNPIRFDQIDARS